MSFQLRVLFSGVCAFVPKRDGTRMWVFLPDESRPYEHEPTIDVPPHRAAIRFKLANLVDDEGTPLTNNPTVRGLWYLDRYDLEIGESSTDEDDCERLDIACYDPVTGAYSAGLQGSAPPKECFSWVAPIEQACAKRGYSGAGQIDPEFLKDLDDEDLNTTLLNKALMARMHIRRGRVYTERRGDYEGYQIVWRFRPFAGDAKYDDHRQLVASQVALDIRVETPFVEFVAKDFEGNWVDSIKLGYNPALGPMAPGAERRVIVDVFNEEGDRILDIGSPFNVTSGQPRVQDRVFESFAKLSTTPPPRKEMPMPVAEYVIDYGVKPDPTAAAAPPCSPARMEPA